MPPCPDAPPPLSAHSPFLAAAVMWGVIIVGVLVFEYWAWKTHHKTLSQAVQRQPAWMRWLAEVGVLALGAHLFGLF